MTDTLIIDYNAFDQQSRLYIVKDGKRSESTVTSDINTLASQIVALANEHGIYDVKLHAPFAFIGEVNRAVKAVETATYSMNKINVEGL